MTRRSYIVVWDPPAPRSGWRGTVDRFVGPGATGAEYALQTVGVAALSAAALATTVGSPEAASFSTLQWVVLVLLTVDITGGVVTNATSAAKRWYHRRGQGRRQHLGFVAVHGVQLALFTAVLHGMGWAATALCYGALVATALLVTSAPLYLQRPLAMALFAGLLLLSLAVVPVGSSLAWFLPLLFLKLIVGHLLPEAPFRPATPRGTRRIPGRGRSPAPAVQPGDAGVKPPPTPGP